MKRVMGRNLRDKLVIDPAFIKFLIYLNKTMAGQFFITLPEIFFI
jgi:hypothetical protein